MTPFGIFFEAMKQGDKKFVAVMYDHQTTQNLRQWAEDSGFDLTVSYGGERQKAEQFDFHTTIFFTTSRHTTPANGDKKQVGTVEVVGLEMLGVDKDIPVLKVKSPDLIRIRKTFEVKYGMRDSWPEYKPHISLTYNRNKKIDLDQIQLPTFPLRYDVLTVRKQDC